MTIDSYFSQSYTEARLRFLELCQANGFSLNSYRNDSAQAPDGNDLVMDVASKGSVDARRLVVLFSGTHGVEGYRGSGIQSALLGEGHFSEPHADVRIALVHAVNPYGFAHNRRVNEDNIDLNRNFLDFGNERPRDNGYSDIHRYLAPEHWDGPAREAADAGLADFIKANSPAAFQHAASGGQYTHSDGVFYGGDAASWSARTVVSVVSELAIGADEVCLIDFHTGLGPYGVGELIAAGSPEQVRRSFEFYSDFEVTDPDAGTSSSAPIQGTMAHGLERALPNHKPVFIALEYGTLAMKDVMTALRADNWLYSYGDVHSPQGQAIKTQIRDAFYCDESKWKTMVFERALEVANTTIR